MTSKDIKKIEHLCNKVLNNNGATHGLQRALRNLRKELVLYSNHLKGLSKLKNKIDLKKGKLQIGSLGHSIEGFVNLDIVPPADIIYDVREGLPIKDSSVSFIFAEHFLEHIDYPTSVKFFMKECHRVLLDGGKLVIGVPDGEYVIRKYVEKDEEYLDEIIDKWYKNRNCLEHFNTYIDFVNYVFRDQDDDDKYTPHLWAYDYDKLVSLYKEAGFRYVDYWNFDPSIAQPKRQWGSIYIEGRK